jgi:hypothetical protein
MEAHLEYACPLAPARCPYFSLGCVAELTRKDVPGHLDDCAQSHLLLSLQRMNEQTATIASLEDRITSLEASRGEDLACTEARMGKLGSSLNASMAALAAEHTMTRNNSAAFAEKVAPRLKRLDSFSSDAGSSIKDNAAAVKKLGKFSGEASADIKAHAAAVKQLQKFCAAAAPDTAKGVKWHGV